MLSEADGLLASYLDRKAVERLIDRHQRGVEDATDRIWRMLNLQIWGELFLKGKDHTELAGLFPRVATVS